MSAAARAAAPDRTPASPAPRPPASREAPRIAIHAFAETAPTRAAFDAFAADRRLARAPVETAEGGVAAAVARYAAAPSPDLLLVESALDADALPLELDRLAEVCRAGTRVVVIGHVNDIALYRTLMGLGVAEYLVAPAGALALVETVERLFCDAEAGPVGRVLAFLGASGGAGSSTVARNVAWTLAARGRDALLVDLDLAFGAAALEGDVEAGRGVAEAMREVERLDAALLERLAAKRGERLSILGSAASLDGPADPDEAAVRRLIEVAERDFPFIALDLPHRWSDWAKAALRRADAVALTAAPTLASLRNAANLLDALKALRPNDPPPLLVLNRVGAAPGEPSAREIEATLGLSPACRLAFEPKLFAEAGARGTMLAETRRGGTARRRVEALAAALAEDAPPPPRRRRLRFWRGRGGTG